VDYRSTISSQFLCRAKLSSVIKYGDSLCVTDSEHFSISSAVASHAIALNIKIAQKKHLTGHPRRHQRWKKGQRSEKSPIGQKGTTAFSSEGLSSMKSWSALNDPHNASLKSSTRFFNFTSNKCNTFILSLPDFHRKIGSISCIPKHENLRS